MKRKKVAVVHPRFLSGGSEARALWSLQALRSEYDMSLITCGRVDLKRLNAYYGTSLVPEDFRLLRVSLPPGVTAHRFNALQGHILQRYCQRVAPQFDVMISAYNPVNFGVPGIQCIADFCFMPEWRFTLHPALRNQRGWWYADSPLRRAYLGLCNLISRGDFEDLREDTVVSNSLWSAHLVKEKLGIGSRLLYPPVSDDFADTPHEKRENGFVCIGSVLPEKRMDAIIEILRKVRERGHDVHLHILGGIGESAFCKRLKELATLYRDWVFLEGRVEGARKKDLISRHRFGIHGCKNEAFGIAVAEMVKAGCVVLVPDGGGQTEIVNSPDLIYRDDDEAVNKIDALLRDPAKQESLRKDLAESGRRFSTQAFADGIRQIVRDFIERKDCDKVDNSRAASSA